MLQTIETEFYAELEEKKSKFLAFLVPIEQFEARLEDLRIEHRKANHHVTAFRLIHEDDHIEEGAKDDGEPAGTSGMPMLKVLIGREIINCGVIVVRYFGGTKLGAGGLARAYSGVASMALDAATLVPWQRIVQKTFTGRFDQTSEIERQIALLQLSVLDRSYHEAGVDILLEGPKSTIESMAAFMHELNLY
ncbi:IMPACT family protein [Cohaesibacter marisflavi]|uniref:IMPACT family protein n=1 Tax=Cohaesibacter marisflavi TaxID=655353 RepID=UPI0029C7A2AD|nr:YigZ family protein [Cohaesibacter marisflavi]